MSGGTVGRFFNSDSERQEAPSALDRRRLMC